MMHNGPDQVFLLQMPDSDAGKRAVNFKTFDEDALADEFEGRDFFKDAVVGGLVECDGVHGLVLDLALRPLLFLCCFSA
jgi:hypothetical protein